MSTRPDRTEAADYYFTYIDRVAGDDICQVLDAQAGATIGWLCRIAEQRSLHRYAPDKWSIREVLSHVNDTERLFVSRALWFARGFDAPLPGFDQNVAVRHAHADERSWASHLDEFQTIRASTITCFQHLPADAWTRRGVANDNPFSVRALAYIVAGHVMHHMAILQERYL